MTKPPHHGIPCPHEGPGGKPCGLPTWIIETRGARRRRICQSLHRFTTQEVLASHLEELRKRPSHPARRRTDQEETPE